MDENKYLIFLKERDKTAKIRSLQMRGKLYVVRFVDSPKEYTYALRDVEVLASRAVTDVALDHQVYHGDTPIAGVERVVDFGPKVRLISNRGVKKVYDAHAIRVERTGVSSASGERVIEYWSEIAKYASVSDRASRSDTFLQKQFDRLKPFISSRSVLAAYLNHAQVLVAPSNSLDTVFPFRFNLSQREALNNALRSQISIIEGPPGTGKTQTILNILANLVMHNKTVAVVSSNNAATQNVQDKLDAQGYGFLAAALGNATNRKRFFEDPPVADVADWDTEDDREGLSKELAELNLQITHLMETERERAKLQHELSAYQLEQEHFETFYQGNDVDETKVPSFRRPTPNRLLSFLKDLRSMSGNDNISFLRRLLQWFRYGFISSKRIAERADILFYIQRKYYKSKIEQMTRQIAQLDRRMSQESFASLLPRHHEISEQLFRQHLRDKYKNRPNSSYSPVNYKRQFQQFIQTYPIVLSTTHSLRNCIPDNFLFDYVIIDESSQVDLVTAALALSCGQNAIIVGDTKQLPQIVDMRIQPRISVPEQVIGTPYDYFQHNILSSMLSLYGDSLPRVMLREHYRCHPKIIDFCNQKYYGGQLIPFTTEQKGDKPLLIYRTAQGNHMSRSSHGSKGRFNQRELYVIENEVLAGHQKETRHYGDIGFATPYRKQVEKATSQLDGAIEKDTIHKYQGREKRVMILSTVLDGSSAGRRGLAFVNDPCMINVAVSRAQERLILVTDHAMFRDTGSEIGDLLRYMEYSTLDENIIDSEIVSVFDLLYRDYSEKLVGLSRRVKKRSKYDTENIMRALIQDILHEVGYNGLACAEQVFIRNLFRDLNKLTRVESCYVKNGSSVDFVVYRKLDKVPVLAIEVDGFTYHENNPEQLKRDHMKNNIFATYGLPLLRLSTTGSDERQRICKELDGILSIH